MLPGLCAKPREAHKLGDMMKPYCEVLAVVQSQHRCALTTLRETSCHMPTSHVHVGSETQANKHGHVSFANMIM